MPEGQQAGDDSRKAEGRVYDLTLPEADYPEWRGAPRRTILICTQQRSGSTMLGEAVYFAGGLGCPLEYFHRGFRPAFEKRWGTSGIEAYVRAVHRLRTDPGGVLSVKLFWEDVVDLARKLAPAGLELKPGESASQADDATYRLMLSAVAEVFPHPSWVFLRRGDTLRQAVSLSVASQTRSWRQFSERKDSRRPPYDFDQIVQALARIQNENRHCSNFFQANTLRYYEVLYEDLTERYEATLRQLFEFLGRPEAQISPPRLRKQANADSEELLRKFMIEFRRRASGR
jgi:LPS sulfotransferase NodH